jgi:uncharacterized protein YkwD
VASKQIARTMPVPQRGLAMFAAAGVVAAALVAGTGTPAAHATTTTSASGASYFISAINAERVAHHKPRLAVSGDMMAAAQRWASQMARSNQLYHNPGLAHSVSNWRFLGENVGVGYSDSSLEAAFYASPEHRANMLDSDYTQIGVAVVIVNGKYWVAEEYRRPMTSEKAKVVHRAKPKHKAKHKSSHHVTAKKVDLKVGSEGSLVAVVQRLLHITSDGMFGPQTKAAVENFQRHHHLRVTGQVTAPMLAALKE